MSNDLSPFQQKRKAQAIANNLKLKAQLADLASVIQDLFNDAPPAAAAATSAEEMKELIDAIDAGTAEQNKIARFLELADEFGLT